MRYATALLLLIPSVGCIRVKTEPVEVKPIHITVDVNLRIDRELEDFFGDLDALDPSMKAE
ncbi:MAG: hypothetical protein HN742_25890 [Lentisphaerae bacterium]|nr:hypothetical protein [Lentisphaerota bacterium]MBT4818523.1 hypothetical protein [Lentisphaerota bacterium]MBT5606521.1 hypothetical protein [Lentisphaerota bacterium]MBT7060148.1 hypothetical protein [Lentisphaerota bacterium]MBT7845333.1 hypothetical protein [Lentisphaerota bacterium]